MNRIPVFQTKQEVPSLFWRPLLQFSYLPFQTKWEATRRHPVYLVSWEPKDVSTLVDESGNTSLFQEDFDASRSILLGAIGVDAKVACNPATDFSELGELNSAWKSGAVVPMSFRKLATLLVAFLPKTTLANLGMTLVEAGCEDETVEATGEPVSKKLQSIRKIASADHEGLDLLCPEPFVSINPGASQRQVGREINDLLKQWKDKLELEEARERNTKHPEYFSVWDMREGWSNGAYAHGKRKTFAQIASEKKVPLTTVHAQYKRAFQLITGHSYCFDTYFTLFGWFKFSGLFTKEADLKYEKLIVATNRPVPESRLGISIDSFTEPDFAPPKSLEYTADELVLDFKNLTEGGLSDQKAAAELGVKNLEALHSLIELTSLSA